MRRLGVLLFSASLAAAQEQIIVSNAASLISTGTAAAGSMFSIELFAQPGDPFPTIDPTSLNVTVLPNGATFAEECGIIKLHPFPMEFLGPNQVLAVLPWTVPPGPAQLRLYHSGQIATTQITIVPSSLGLFPQSEAYLTLQIGSDQVQTLNQLTHPAQPGDTIAIWATGLGSATQVTVLVGGRVTTSSFAGHVSYMPGVDQIQFVVPNDPTIPNDCYVAVAAQLAGVTTNEIWISKTSDGSACQSKLGFTGADLLQLDQGGAVGLAQLTVTAVIGEGHSPPGPFGMEGESGFTRTESADFLPSQVNAAQAALVSGPVVADDAFFGCTSSLPLALTAGLAGVLNGPSDFGNEVTLQGAGGTLDLFPLNTCGPLFTGVQTSPAVSDPSQLSPPLFAPGAEVFFGSGEPFPLSTAVPVPAAFSVPLTLPPEIMVTNLSALQTINRQQDLVVTWDPTGFGEQDVLTVTLNNAAKPVATPFGLETEAPLATCRIPAASGQIVVPAGMLISLPPTKPGGPPSASISLAVAPRSGPTQTFSLPYTMEGNPQHAVLRFSSSESWPVIVE